jgi:hypothetical protein
MIVAEVAAKAHISLKCETLGDGEDEGNTD